MTRSQIVLTPETVAGVLDAAIDQMSPEARQASIAARRRSKPGAGSRAERIRLLRERRAARPLPGRADFISPNRPDDDNGPGDPLDPRGGTELARYEHLLRIDPRRAGEYYRKHAEAIIEQRGDRGAREQKRFQKERAEQTAEFQRKHQHQQQQLQAKRHGNNKLS